jgi:rRNA maturation RNase YbeY
MASKSKVYFFFDDIQVNLKNRRRIKDTIEMIFIDKRKTIDHLNYVFCSDESLLKMNKNYLKHDYYTDIITFNLTERKTGDITGEVYISVDRVRDNAGKIKSPLNHELARVIFHGALHLCGCKDKTKEEKKKMRDMEDFYLKKYLA